MCFFTHHLSATQESLLIREDYICAVATAVMVGNVPVLQGCARLFISSQCNGVSSERLADKTPRMGSFIYRNITSFTSCISDINVERDLVAVVTGYDYFVSCLLLCLTFLTYSSPLSCETGSYSR